MYESAPVVAIIARMVLRSWRYDTQGAGLCSDCTQILSAVPVVPVPSMMNVFAGAPQFDTAA